MTVSASEPTAKSAFTLAANDTGNLDALPFDGAEAGQRERDRVGAGPQVDDLSTVRSRR